jgi:tRNA A37 methylthiotransferase MiaB
VMPHACIGVDVIVGFPGETDEHFLGTIVIWMKSLIYMFSSILNVTIQKLQKC